MIIDTDALAASMANLLMPQLRTAIQGATATTTADTWGREIASALGVEMATEAKRFARDITRRLVSDPTLLDELTAVCRAGLLDGARRGAEEAGVKVGTGAAKAAVQVDQLRLVERAR